MDRTQGLRLFLSIARSGSFSAVARQQQCAVSSITRQIDALETDMGVRLFARTTHHLQLTEAGELLRDRVAGALAELDDAIREVAESDERLRGQLRLTAPIAFGERYLRPLLPRLVSTFPDLRFDLDLSNEYRDLVREHIDLAVRVGSTQDERLVAQALTGNTHLLCASPTYLAGHAPVTSLDDLAQQHCLRHNIAGTDPHWRFTVGDTVRKLLPRGPVESNNSDIILDAALSHCGIALLPWWMVHEAMQDGRLVQVLAQEAVMAPLGDALYLAYPLQRRRSRKVAAVRDFLLAELGTVGNRPVI